VVKCSLEALAWLREQVETAATDLLCDLIRLFAEALMDAEASALCNADYGERTPERTTTRNGYRPRRWDTRVGTMAVAIFKLRKGSYFPEWLLEPPAPPSSGWCGHAWRNSTMSGPSPGAS
jgi:transposase-like protein